MQIPLSKSLDRTRNDGAASRRYADQVNTRTSKHHRVVGLYGRSVSWRAKAKIGLQNLAYDIRRFVTLERMAAA